VQNTDTSVFHLSVDTPGSNQDRAITVGYFVDQRAKSLEAELASPWKKMLVKGIMNVITTLCVLDLETCFTEENGMFFFKFFQ